MVSGQRQRGRCFVLACMARSREKRAQRATASPRPALQVCVVTRHVCLECSCCMLYACKHNTYARAVDACPCYALPCSRVPSFSSCVLGHGHADVNCDAKRHAAACGKDAQAVVRVTTRARTTRAPLCASVAVALLSRRNLGLSCAARTRWHFALCLSTRAHPSSLTFTAMQERVREHGQSSCTVLTQRTRRRAHVLGARGHRQDLVQAWQWLLQRARAAATM